jgi:hypothetical protein
MPQDTILFMVKNQLVTYLELEKTAEAEGKNR